MSIAYEPKSNLFFILALANSTGYMFSLSPDLSEPAQETALPDVTGLGSVRGFPRIDERVYALVTRNGQNEFDWLIREPDGTIRYATTGDSSTIGSHGTWFSTFSVGSDLVALWRQGNPRDVYFARFDAEGAALDTPQVLTSDLSYHAYDPSASYSEAQGAYLVAWHRRFASTHREAIFATYDASGTRLSDPQTISTPGGNVGHLRVAAYGTGWVVRWHDLNQSLDDGVILDGTLAATPIDAASATQAVSPISVIDAGTAYFTADPSGDLRITHDCTPPPTT